MIKLSTGILERRYQEFKDFYKFKESEGPLDAVKGPLGEFKRYKTHITDSSDEWDYWQMSPILFKKD